MHIPAHSPGKTYQPHEIEMAAEHLMNAEKVRGNPELHAHALRHLSGMKKHISSIEQIRQKGRELNKESDEPAMEEAVETPEMEASEENTAVKGKKKVGDAIQASAAHAPRVEKKKA